MNETLLDPAITRLVHEAAYGSIGGHTFEIKGGFDGLFALLRALPAKRYHVDVNVNPKDMKAMPAYAPSADTPRIAFIANGKTTAGTARLVFMPVLNR